ncbi:hypothetical protein ELQ87_32420 [Streptomyces griseoviridis]|uniref:Uncharacterized protein n=2 Tax=Streptomyces griseoviridis TaxID=45398 RepID=A0A3S9ZL84_STRGD|nr:hypothetical protein [Streptomyces griseoviridis]AZS88422.1 hypothetical protein ELQ87_32420 [Streptomyces griseoviridis]
MSSGHRTMTLFVTVLLGMILVILGLCADWPRWAWPALAALLPAVAAVTHRILAPAREAFPRELLPDPDLPLPEPIRQEQRVAHVALPSSVADYDFSFSATVRWLVLNAPEDAPYVNPAGLAVEAVLQRARLVAVQQPPHRSAFTQHQLDGALATMRPEATGRVMAMAQDVSLTLPESDRERLAKLSGVRKDEDVWEHERNYERSKRSYLTEDVLKDAGSAVVWWLSRNEGEVEGAVDRIGVLARLSAAARNEEVPPPFDRLTSTPGIPYPDEEEYLWHRPFSAGRVPSPPAEDTVTDPYPTFDSVLAWFGFSDDDADVQLFSERVAKLAEVHGRSEAADAIKSRFGGPGPEEDDGPDSGGEAGPGDGPGAGPPPPDAHDR